MTSKDLMRLAVVDDVIREPLGGAHRDHHLMANRLKSFFRNSLRELIEQPIDQLLEARYQKFRRMGVFLEGGARLADPSEEDATNHQPRGARGGLAGRGPLILCADFASALRLRFGIPTEQVRGPVDPPRNVR